MYIGFDIDDILFDTFPVIRWTVKCLFGIVIPSDPSDFSILDENLDRDQLRKVLDYCLTNPAIIKVNRNCLELIMNIIKSGVQEDIVFITSRSERLKERTVNLLDMYLPVEYSLFMCERESKLGYAHSLGLTHFVEDRYKHARILAESGITVFMRKRSWNKGREEHRNIIPFNDYSMVKDYLKL